MNGSYKPKLKVVEDEVCQLHLGRYSLLAEPVSKDGLV